MVNKIISGPKLIVPKASVGDYLWKCLEKYGERIWQIDTVTGEKENYTSALIRSRRVAIGLQKRGICSKDVICLCTENSMDSCIPILASFFLGAKVTNLEPTLSIRHTKHLISLISPKIIFADESSLELIEQSLDLLDLNTDIVVFGKSDKYPIFGDFLGVHKDEESFRPVNVDINDVALMFFSSGTTGMPKAICHSHTSYLAILKNGMDQLNENLLHFTTMYWISGLIALGKCIEDGGTRAFFSRSINGKETFEIIERYKISSIFMAPTLTHKLTSVNNYQDYDTSSLKYLLTGGTAINTKQISKLETVFPNVRVLIGYGMSEIGVISLFTPEMVHSVDASDLIQSKINAGSCGKLADGITLKIRDPNTGDILGANEKGELCVKSQALMLGYYKADCGEIFDEDYYLRTGDIGYYDTDGFLYIVDRMKEMFKYLSWHIVPSAIESVLQEHPAVQECVVFGLPQGEDGDIPTAWVVLNKNYLKVTGEEIEKFVAERVSDKEKLRGGVSLVESIPKTPTGKMIRNEVRNIAMKSLDCNK